MAPTDAASSKPSADAAEAASELRPPVDAAPASKSVTLPAGAAPARTSSGGMVRNQSAAAHLQTAACFSSQSAASPPPVAPAGMVRRNISSSALSELRRREGQQGGKKESERAVIRAVVLQLRMLMDDVPAAGVPRSNTTPDAAVPTGVARANTAPEAAAPAAADAPASAADISETMRAYIETIVRQLELPNSCIIAMLVYIERAVKGTRFVLTTRNWQPCLLAAFVVAAKLSFDEPVWNEDFVKALRISNVQVSQISRWEADFLQLIGFNTNVALLEYTSLCFQLQQRYMEHYGGERVQFFSFLMAQAKDISANDHSGGSSGGVQPHAAATKAAA